MIGEQMEPYIKTRSGKLFHFDNPSPASVTLTDVAHSLSNKCRFSGHTRTFFSVAQHSCESALLAHSMAPEGEKDDAALAALLHDAHEAYLGDVTSPLKVYLGASLRSLEKHIQDVVLDAFGITGIFETYKTLTKHVDLMLLYSDAVRWGMDGVITEGGVEYPVERVWVPKDFEPVYARAIALSPAEAKDQFLALFAMFGGHAYVAERARALAA